MLDMRYWYIYIFSHVLRIDLNENNNIIYIKYYNYIFKLILYDEH